MTLKRELEIIVLKYSGNGHSEDPFFCEVRAALTRPKKESGPKVFYNFTDSLWHGISDEQVSLWSEAYPAVDIELELRQMGEWCKASGAKGRKQNWIRFVVNWLKRAQDRGGSAPQKGNRWAKSR